MMCKTNASKVNWKEICLACGLVAEPCKCMESTKVPYDERQFACLSVDKAIDSTIMSKLDGSYAASCRGLETTQALRIRKSIWCHFRPPAPARWYN